MAAALINGIITWRRHHKENFGTGRWRKVKTLEKNDSRCAFLQRKQRKTTCVLQSKQELQEFRIFETKYTFSPVFGASF
jgi:hypothetical protein